MADFILGKQFLDRPLIDHTGIPGREGFTLRDTRDEARTR
jgi:hypothetical protein